MNSGSRETDWRSRERGRRLRGVGGHQSSDKIRWMGQEGIDHPQTGKQMRRLYTTEEGPGSKRP